MGISVEAGIRIGKAGKVDLFGSSGQEGTGRWDIQS
jgi:hypothetical protein